MKKIRLNLITKIFIAIILGILLGNFTPLFFVRIFSTFNALFSNFLQFAIPLIIVGLVAPAIGDIGKGVARMLVVTLCIVYASTILSGIFSYTVSSGFFPSLLSHGDLTGLDNVDTNVAPYFTIAMPQIMGVTSALIFSIIFGLGIAYMDLPNFKNNIKELNLLIVKLIDIVIIPLLPIFIFGTFLIMTYTGSALKIVKVFISIIGIIFLMHIILILVQYFIAGGLSHKNPFKLLRTMLPAYFTAFGTSSSAATIPVSLNQTIKNGVNPDIAGFVIPLCATIHLSGSIMKITACATAIMIITGLPFDFGLMIGFILMLAVVMVAAPGVPGGAIMASLGVLSTILGFGQKEQALMIALYIAMDNFGTACNVTGDGAIAIVVDKIFGKK